jgi:hypothetical protein
MEAGYDAMIKGIAFMNHLVFLDSNAGELEKILSGVKTMLVKEFDPAQTTAHPVNPGDSLYFLRNKDDCAVRVKATVVRVLYFTNRSHSGLSQTLKEMQPKLQLTEDQYNHWSAQQQVLLVEFGSAHKIDVIHVAPDKITDRSDWIAFQVLSRITE